MHNFEYEFLTLCTAILLTSRMNIIVSELLGNHVDSRVQVGGNDGILSVKFNWSRIVYPYNPQY